jgi:GntR family transcriptional repressor for pyruvate dehydrogenase complex
MESGLTPIDWSRRQPLAIEVARSVLRHLLSGDIHPGEQIPPERQLAQTLGVGRSVVREALKALMLLGLIEVRQGDGTYLKSTSSDLLPQVIEWSLLLGTKETEDLIESRQVIEVIIARLAAQRRSADDVEELRRILEQMRIASGDPDAFTDADVRFHIRLVEATGNTVLKGILNSIRALLSAWISRVMHAERDIKVTYDEHVRVFEAVQKGDPEAAATAMRLHMEAARKRLEAVLRAHQTTSTKAT